MTQPRISIVTPTWNRAEFLGDAIESVLAQNYPNFEHIVVDGMSTDGTVELLARYPHLRVIREPDSGLYEALNKGLRAATGEITGHLNSDDLYTPGTFQAVAAAFGDAEIDAVFGGAEVFEGSAVEPRCVGLRITAPDEIALSFRNLTMRNPITNARFFHRRVYEQVGFNDERYRISSDRDFLLRVALTNPRVKLLDRIVYAYRMHDGSLTINRDDPHSRTMRDEFLAIAGSFLARADLPDEAHYWCVRWQERESAHCATHALFADDWRALVDYTRQGIFGRPTWPLMFARHVGGALLARWKGQR